MGEPGERFCAGALRWERRSPRTSGKSGPCNGCPTCPPSSWMSACCQEQGPPSHLPAQAEDSCALICSQKFVTHPSPSCMMQKMPQCPSAAAGSTCRGNHQSCSMMGGPFCASPGMGSLCCINSPACTDVNEIKKYNGSRLLNFLWLDLHNGHRYPEQELICQKILFQSSIIQLNGRCRLAHRSCFSLMEWSLPSADHKKLILARNPIL